MTTEIARRSFLESTGGALMLSLFQLQWRASPGRSEQTAVNAAYSAEAVEYQKPGDLYRRRWTWDRVAKGTHHVNCWYQRGCCFDVYVKDGLVSREEQAGTYAQTNPEVPDYNPRGCQKGACYSERMYDATRLRYPIKRIGARGEGKWKRVCLEVRSERRMGMRE
jgi:nitrate reductase alpha subunit